MKTYYKREETPKMMFWCGDPITLDKSSSWGEGNVQTHEAGCWVQIDNKDSVAHLVAGDETGPVGWIHYNPFENFFPECVDSEWTSTLWKKKPIKAAQIHTEVVSLNTLDGEMHYPNPTKDGWILYNLAEDNGVDLNDSWFMGNEDFLNAYISEEELNSQDNA